VRKGSEQVTFPEKEAVLLQGEYPELSGRLHAYARTERGVRGIPLAEAVRRIAQVTRKGSIEPPAEDAAFFVWIDIAAPGEGEVELLRDQLGFHPLAVEDCIRGRQRPKVERYPGHYFLVVYASSLNAERGRPAFNELHMFIGNGFIVTVRDNRISQVRDTLARWRSTPDRFPTVGAVAHALLDEIVDDYFPMVDHFSDQVSAAEAKMVDDSQHLDVKDVHELRRQIILFRRVVAPERDIIARLVRRDLPFLSPDLVPYFQDVRDHLIRIVEEIDTLRELVGSTLEGYASQSSHNLNNTMRRMAAWSIILMSMNLVASNYGMNFRFMPEIDWPGGYPLAVGAMLMVGASLGYLFRRLKWL
jgi:magnesium transporter